MSNKITKTKLNDDQAVPYLPSIGRLLGFSSKVCSELSEKMLLPSGLTLKQWVLLTALWRGDGLTVGELAVYYRASEPSTSNLIARMEKKGLLVRKHDKLDRRQVKVFLTDEGRSLTHLVDFYSQVNEALLEGFSEAEKQQFTQMLERVIENSQKKIQSL
ncbi:MAG: MarR family transcriptional regulator [Hyphomicrobiales bacterium]